MIVYVLGGGRMTWLNDHVSLRQLSGPRIRDTHDCYILHGWVLQDDTFQLGRGHLIRARLGKYLSINLHKARVIYDGKQTKR